MSSRVRDTPALVSAIVVLALGAVLALDAADLLELRLAVLAPLFLAAIGAILLATGLDGRRTDGPEPPA